MGVMSTDASAPSLVATRNALHAVAEHVLAAALHAATGRIGLRVTPGGFGTPWYATADDGRRRIRVEGTDLVVDEEGGAAEPRRAPLTTIGGAAALVGIEPGGPAGVYTLQTPLVPDAVLAIDPAAAQVLAEVFAAGDEALARLAGDLPDDGGGAQLWPEHFDLGLSAEEVNYGVSPGDEGHDDPYVYVGPWTPRSGEFWNESFGASRPWNEVRDAESMLEFFREGRRLALS